MSCGRPERTSIPTTGSLPRDRRSEGLSALRPSSGEPGVLPGRGRGHSECQFAAARGPRFKPWKADPRLPIMRRPCADRGENHDPADAPHTRGLQNRLTQRPRLENWDTTIRRKPDPLRRLPRAHRSGRRTRAACCAKRDPLRCSFARSYGSCGGSVRWIIDQYTEKMKSKWKQFQRSACAELEFEMIFL
jgi:hypothetical protein